MGNLFITLPAGILFIPLLAFAAILFFGKWLDKIADRIAIAAMGFAFLMALCLFSHAGSSDYGAHLQAHPIINSFSWLKISTASSCAWAFWSIRSPLLWLAW